jgi:predicted NAD/FAD-binding protein
VTRTAIVGSGISGLTAAHVAQKSSQVVLFEADERLGGHAHTHDIPGTSGTALGVDTGFIVHNDRTYPVLLRLFAELGVATRPTEMSMSVVCEGCGVQYAGARRLAGILAQPRRLADPRYLRMLVEVPRFHKRAKALLLTEGTDVSLRDFLDSNRFSSYFVDHFAIPVVSCVWSCPPSAALDYPARYLFAFLENHGMLTVTGSPQWRTVVGGSREYVRKLSSQLDDVRTSAGVRTVRRLADGVELTLVDGTVERADHVIIATHPDQALELLADATPLEKEVLGVFRYEPNETVLHCDVSLLPTAPRAHASWNYRTSGCGAAGERVLVSYDMNRLQGLTDDRRLIVTLNGTDRIDPASIIKTMHYAHPSYTLESVAMQKRVPELNGGRTAFAGAWTGWGFHEDGARSGLAAAESLGLHW